MHLYPSHGVALTECGLMSVIPREVTSDLEELRCRDCRAALIARGVCPECGEKRLAWSAGPVKLNSISEGRLTMRDVETQFYLGCEECSETLVHSVSPDRVAAALTAIGWRP